MYANKTNYTYNFYSYSYLFTYMKLADCFGPKEQGADFDSFDGVASPGKCK